MIGQVCRESLRSIYVAFKLGEGALSETFKAFAAVGTCKVLSTEVFQDRQKSDESLKKRRQVQQEGLARGSLSMLEQALLLRGSHGSSKSRRLAGDMALRVADRITAAQADGLRHRAQEVAEGDRDGPVARFDFDIGGCNCRNSLSCNIGGRYFLSVKQLSMYVCMLVCRHVFIRRWLSVYLGVHAIGLEPMWGRGWSAWCWWWQ